MIKRHFLLINLAILSKPSSFKNTEKELLKIIFLLLVTSITWVLL